MNIDYIETLEYNNVSKMYDLTVTTFNGKIDYTNIGFFLVTRKHEMRMDLVSNDLYNDTTMIGVLCQLNDIYNPFSIKDGNILIYLPKSEMKSLSLVEDSIKYGVVGKTKSDFINSLKKKLTDKSRIKFLKNRKDDIIPSISTDNTPQIIVEGNKILISPNKYQPPKSDDRNIIEDVEDDITGVIQEDNIERRLVNRYIKYLNQ